MASLKVSDCHQDLVKCGLCQNPVSFFCRRCRVKLCDSCVPIHLRVKSEFGHDVVDYASNDDDDDDKIEVLLKDITQENDRLQSFRFEIKTLLDHMTKQLSSLSSIYQKKKDDVTFRGQEWHKLIDDHVKKLHQELDGAKIENEIVLQKQKREFEEIIGKMDEMNRKTTRLQKSKNITELHKFRAVIKEQKTLKEFTQYTIPIFHECKIDKNYLQTYFGYIEKMQEKKVPLLEMIFIPDSDSSRNILQVPSVSFVIDTEFPAEQTYGSRLYDMTVTDDLKVWVGGASTELKLFDLQGHLHRTVPITDNGMYICMYNKQVVYSDQSKKAVKKISDNDTVVTMFTTGDWLPYGITGSASGDLFACLLKDDQSKVVKYSSTGTVLQEMQYDLQGQPLYQFALYITENVNGDIIVTDFKKRIVIAVDRLGIFRYKYLGKKNDFYAMSVVTDSVGHVYATDFEKDKIHMLDRDGRFLRYIIPEGGIEDPRVVCMIGDGEMIVGECLTGLVKRVKFLE
uniref:Uncharacterized protein LOC111109841 n=1 Tax=Crassostrea virginica TaxID=6565 RepID=A0A8B8BEJ6_CRAVI|nr:uncharacterized protein LOC111109841 [Crassostrea virginica]